MPDAGPPSCDMYRGTRAGAASAQRAQHASRAQRPPDGAADTSAARLHTNTPQLLPRRESGPEAPGCHASPAGGAPAKRPQPDREASARALPPHAAARAAEPPRAGGQPQQPPPPAPARQPGVSASRAQAGGDGAGPSDDGGGGGRSGAGAAGGVAAGVQRLEVTPPLRTVAGPEAPDTYADGTPMDLLGRFLFYRDGLERGSHHVVTQ